MTQEEKEIEDLEPQPQVPEAEVLESEVDRFRQEATDYKDKYMRTLAENENARKRMQKERQEMTQFALQNLIVDFLDPIDHMENALRYSDQMTGEVKHWAIGFQMILNQFKDVLASNGVSLIDSMGKQFDPHLHEAIEVIETVDVPAGTIVEESVRGYKMGDRTIRPARVKVAKEPAAPAQE